jgi:hypothetical protein
MVGDEGLHYPMFLVLLPQLYHLLYLPVVIIAGFVLFGWAVSEMCRYFEKRRGNSSVVTSAAGLIPSMILVGLVFVVAVQAVGFGFSYLGEAVERAFVRKAVVLLGVSAVVAVQSMLIYALIFVIRGRGWSLDALKSSVAFARHNFALTAGIVLTVTALHYPLEYLLARTDKIVLKFTPELVPVLMAVGILIEMFSNYFIFSATTSLVYRTPKRERSR